MIGTVKSYRTRNGCGFLTSPSAPGDVFVHVSNILDNTGDPSDLLLPGEGVEFGVIQGQRGLTAVQIRRLEPMVLDQCSGVIKRCFQGDGYGFIESSHGDVFFHYTDLMFDGVESGLAVTYLKAYVRDRPRAVRIWRNPDG